MTAVAPSAPISAPRIPPLVASLALIMSDLVSTLVFTAVYASTHSLGVSFAVAVGAGLAGIAWTRRRGRRVDLMQWMSLGLVVVFGAAALMTHDKRFIMVKPTLIYLAVGATMLKSGWMTRYMPPRVLAHAPDVADRFGYLWAAAMFAMAAANAALVAHGDFKLWAGFLAVAPLTLKAVLIPLQYGVTRRVIGRRLIAARFTHG